MRSVWLQLAGAAAAAGLDNEDTLGPLSRQAITDAFNEVRDRAPVSNENLVQDRVVKQVWDVAKYELHRGQAVKQVCDVAKYKLHRGQAVKEVCDVAKYEFARLQTGYHLLGVLKRNKSLREDAVLLLSERRLP